MKADLQELTQKYVAYIENYLSECFLYPAEPQQKYGITRLPCVGLE